MTLNGHHKTNTKNHPQYPYDWSVISARTKQASGWTCANCGIKQGEDLRNNITVHHIDYNPFNNQPKNLIVLCQRCHLRRHGFESQQIRLQRERIRLLQSGQRILPGFDLPSSLPLQLNSATAYRPEQKGT